MVSGPCRQTAKQCGILGESLSKNQHVPTEGTKISIGASVVVHVYNVITWEDDTGES